jgi:hypothetical protein
MFHDSLQNERDLEINFWEEKCPITEGIAFTIPGTDKTKAEVLQLCRYPVIGWPDATPGLFGLRTIQMAPI